MTPLEKENIQRAFRECGNKIHIGIQLTGDVRGQKLQAFCEELKALVPGMRIKKEGPGGGVPSFKIAENVTYQAVPLDKELKPFLDFFSDADEESERLILPGPKILDQVRVPAALSVFISSQCPFCPQTVTSLLVLARHCKQIHITVVDGELFPEIMKASQVRSVPTVMLDSQFRWTGAIDVNEIVDIIISRDPARFGADTLQQMIEEGKAEELSDMMAGSEKIYPAFLDLLTHSKWSVRLGAMVVFEYLNENSDLLAMQVLDELWGRFESADNAVKGDILYLFGESNRAEITGRVESVQAGLYSDEVREAARDALNAMA